MPKSKLFKVTVLWVDGSYSTYSMHGLDQKDVENQLLETLHNVRDSIKAYDFEQLGESQYGRYFHKA
jgi:hypothetical protein